MSFAAFFSNNLFTFVLFFLAAGMLLRLEIAHFRQRTPKMSLLGLSRALEEGAQLWDLRSREEHKKGHIAQAISHPAAHLNLQQLKLSKEQIIVLYDENESASHQIAQQLRAAGHGRVYVLDGGLNAWLNENYPLVKA